MLLARACPSCPLSHTSRAKYHQKARLCPSLQHLDGEGGRGVTGFSRIIYWSMSHMFEAAAQLQERMHPLHLPQAI